MVYNFYWPVYMSLEREILELTKYIQFDDNQLGVYSMHIADLLVRCAMEIESLSKEMYWNNDGPKMYDGDKERELYFDTDCIKFLNEKWGICSKKVIVSSSYFFFEEEDNRVLKPLYKADKRSGTKWNKAYQAVKHDRKNSLACGNLSNLINALAALYILNIYHISDKVMLGDTITPSNDFDSRLGSNLFSVTFVDATKNVSMGGAGTDEDIDDVVKGKLTEAIYILKYTDESWSNINKTIAEDNERMRNKLIESKEFKEYLLTNENPIKSGEHLYTLITRFFGADYLSKGNCLINTSRAIINGRKEAVINKKQKIYG